MPQARFLLLSSPTASAWEITWRLVAGNNHDLGRSPRPFPDAESAREAIEQLRAALDGMTSGLSPDSRPGRWGWQLRQGTDVTAVSSRWYERQRESRYSLGQFVAAVPVAPLSPTVAVRPRARELRRVAVPRQSRPTEPTAAPAEHTS